MILVVLRFRSPKEALIFAGVVAVGGILAIAIPRCQQASRHEKLMQEEQQHKLVAELATRALHASDDKRKDCFEAINKVLARAPKIIDAPSQEPSDPSALRGAPFVAMKHVLSMTMPAPDSPFIGDGACDFTPSKRLRDAAGMFTAPWKEADYDAAAVEANALIDRIHAWRTPPVVAVTDYRCGRKNGEPCIGVVAWLETTTSKPLAVLRVQRPMEHLGYEKDIDALTNLFFPLLARWQR